MVNDKYVVKYLDPRTGKYEYATVKDVGDLQKLNTKVKTSIVDAINSISANDIEGLKNGLDAIGKTIKSLEDGTLELGDFQSIDDVVSREIEDAINNLKDENSGLLKLTQEEIDKIVSDAESEYRDSIAASVRELETSKSDLEDAREKMTNIGKMLENADIDYSNLTQTVDDINLYIEDVIEKTDFDMVNGIVSDYKTAVTQSKDGWGVDASKNMLSYLTGRVKNNETSLDVQHGLIQAKVGKDEFQYMTVDNLPAGKENMLHNTSDLRDWDFSSAFIFKSADDYRFTSVVQSDSAGENITGTTDELEQGVTYAISAYVNVQNKNKKPNEEKYASTDGNYTATVIIDGDTIELNNVVEDNSELDGWKRVSGTFIAKRTAKQDIKFYVTSFNRDTQVGYLSAPKLEKGSSATSWIPHIEDNVSTILSQNAVMRVLSDRITSSVEEVRETKGAFETATSTFDQMADGFELNTNKLSEVLDKYGEVTGVQTQQASELKVLNESITSKVWKQDINTTLDTINIDTSNRIVNSAFNIYSYDEQTGELQLDYWDSNTGFEIKKHSQSLDNYLYAKRSNATSVNPISIKSSPFALRDGEKILFNFEYLAVGNPLDNDNVITLEMYDNDDVRVGLQEFKLSELKKEFLTAYDVGDSYKYNGSYIVKNSSVVKGTITLKLPKNGELWLTKIMLQNAGIGTIGWTPSSIDNQIIQSKLSTEINQLADSIELVAKDERLDAISGLLVKKDGKITISPEAIVSRVTSQELGENGLITQTSLKQTEDNLRFDLVDKDGIIQTINASADGLLIDFDKVQIDGEVIARMISAQSIDATQGFRLTDNNGNTLLSVVNDNGKPTLSITKDFRVKFGEIGDKLDVTIIGVVEEYYYSVDPNEPIGGRWTSTPNAFQDGNNRFIWKRNKIIYQSGKVSYYPSETGINITGSWEYEKESVTAEVVRALDSAESAKALAVSEANQAMIDANKYADEQDALIREKVDTSVADAISKADHARQVATDSYNNAVAAAEKLTEEQSEAFNKKFEENASEMDTLSQAAQDADTKAQEALSKAGTNANVLATHQESLNTINEVTIPNINISISNVMSEAKSALSSAKSAMDEAKKTDGKIATMKESIDESISDVNETAQSALTEANKTDGKIATLKESISKDVKSVSDTAASALSKANTIDTKISGVNTSISDLDTKLSNSISTTSQSLTGQISSASSKAQQALDEAKKADGKIADYVTKNGLVNGTTVDSKIDTATGEISKKITTVEGKIDGLQVGGRNLFRNSNFADELNFWMHNGQVTRVKVDKNDAVLLTGTNYGFFQTPTQLEDDEVYTISFKAKSVGDSSQVRFGFFNQPYRNSTSTSISNTWKTYSFTTNGKFDTSSNTFVHFYAARDTAEGVYITDLKVEKGSIPTDWSPAPEDNLSQSEFQIFESTYDEDVKGINSTLTDLSNKKLDGTTYTDFYENDYKRTAKSASDAFTAVNKIVSEDGTVKDVFSKAVYEQNASRQSSDFNEVTKDLVKTATYESGIDGVKEIITSVEGKVDNIKVGGRNLIPNFHNSKWILPSALVISEDGYMAVNSTNSSSIASIEIPVEKDTDYTFSLKGVNGRWYIYKNSYTDGVIIRTISEILDGKSIYTFNSEDAEFVTIMLNTWSQKVGTERVWSHLQLERGNIVTDWSPSPEDNLSDAEFRTFESEYSRNSKEITERLSTVENSKLDGSTYTDFYENSYKKTAKDATDAYTAVNRIVDADGNSTENFAKAVYERNAQRQKSDFESATEGLLRTATYEEGIDGIKNSLSEVEGKIPTSVGGRNYFAVKNLTPIPATIGSYKVYDIQLKPNTTYTVSAYGTISGHNMLINKVSRLFATLKSTGYQITTDSTGIMKLEFWAGNITEVQQFIDGIAKLKIEEGTVRTDWTPAPEDTLLESDFKSFQADYEQNAQGITSRLSSAENSITTNNQAFTTFKENDYKRTAERVSDTFTKQETTTMLGGKADASQLSNYLAKSTYERDAEQSKERFETIESDLDNISVGGRNFILNSGEPLINRAADRNGITTSTTDEGYLKVVAEPVNGNYFYFSQLHDLRTNIQISNNFKQGDDLTFSIDIKSPDSTDIPTLYVYGANNAYQELVGVMSTEFSRFHLTVNFKDSPTPVNIVMGIAGKTGTFIFRNPKIEKGNIATDWSPAPEDMANLSYVSSEVTKSAEAITASLANYAKTTDLNGLATETYATNKAVSEAGKVKNELTKYAKTTDLTGLASETYATNVAVSEAGKVSNELTKYAKTTALTGLATETYAQTQATTEAGKVEQKLTGYAKTNDLKGLATETYATNKAVSEAGKVKNELTKYELKTGVDSKISTASSALRTETAEKLKTVYTKSETETLLGKKADSSTLKNYVQTATYESGIDGVSQSLSRVEGKIDGLQIGGRNYALNTGVISEDTYNVSVNIPDELKGQVVTISFYLELENGTVGSQSRIGVEGSNVDTTGKLTYYGTWHRLDDGRDFTGVCSAPIKINKNFSGNTLLLRTFQHLINADVKRLGYVKLEKGTIATDWTPAPEDTLTQDEYKVFKSDYESTVKGITGQITSLSTSKLDGNTYTNFLSNDYKSTAEKATSAFTKVNKVIDANGNSTDAFAKAVYDRNATRQSADFKKVTNGLVKEATYTAGINGISGKITTVEGKIDGLQVGGTNYAFNTEPILSDTSKNVRVRTEVNFEALKGLEGQEITYSFEAKSTVAGQGSVYILDLRNYQTLGGHVDHKNIGTIGTEWKRFEITAKVNSNITLDSKSEFTLAHDSSSSHTVQVRNLKIEKGNVATDWSPAPEDMLGQADFSVFKNTYEKNDKTIKSRLTAIDSGKQGSIAYNANTALSTAQGNTKSITTLDTKVDNLKVGGRNYFKNSDVERTGSGEFVNHSSWDMSPLFNKFGTDTYYTVSFDIKSKVAGNINVYAQNGNGTKYSIGTKSIYVPTTYKRFSYTFKPTLGSSTETRSMLAFYGNYGSGRIPTIKNVKFEVGNFATDWTPAPEDMLGKETFTLFKNDYKDTAKEVSRRLTAIDSSEEGSVVTRLNKTESTASGNSQLISTINKNYVKQSNIDASILADKQIKDTRNTNQLPSWYFSNYPKQQVREFKTTSVMGIGSGTYGILITDVQWRDKSGGTVKQSFETDSGIHTRKGNSAGTAWSAWVKQIDTADKTYQKITQTSSLYERVIGSTEANVKSNMARIVMTDSSFQTEIVDKQDLRTAMASGTGMTSDPYFNSSSNGIGAYDNRKTNTITVKRTKIPSTTSIPAPKGNDGYRLDIRHEASSATTPNRGGIARNTMSWANGTVVIKFVAHLPAGRSFSYHNNGLGTGYTAGWLTDNKGTGKWETYMYYYRFGSSGTFSSFGHLSVTGASTAFSWYLSEYDIINVNETSASKITQLSDNINLKVSKGDISNQININTQGVVIGGNKISLSGQTSVNGDFWAKQVNAVKVKADKIEGTTAQFNSLRSNVLTANSITSTMINANTAMFDKLFSTTSATTRLVAQGAWITNANIVSLNASKITAGTIATARLDSKKIVAGGLVANVIKSTHIQSSNGLIDKIFANDAYIKRMTGKKAFISSIQAIDISAEKITAGIASKTGNRVTITNTGMKISDSTFETEFINGGPAFFSKSSTGRSLIGEIGNMTSAFNSSKALGIKATYGTPIVLGVQMSKTDTTYKGKLAVHGGGVAVYDTLNVEGDILFTQNGKQALRNIINVDKIFLQGKSYITSTTIVGANGSTMKDTSGWINLQAQWGVNLWYQNQKKARMYGDKFQFWCNIEPQSGFSVSGSSDVRLKHNIVDVKESSLEKLEKIKFKNFTWNSNNKDDFGFIAQEVINIIPEIIEESDDGYYRYNSTRFNMIVAHATKELNDKVKFLENKIERLERIIDGN